MPICLVRRCLWTDKTDPTSVGLALSQFTKLYSPFTLLNLFICLVLSLSLFLIGCVFLSPLQKLFCFYIFSEKTHEALVDNDVEKQFVYSSAEFDHPKWTLGRLQ